MNKNRKTYVEPNMKVVYIDPSELLDAGGTSGGGAFGAKQNEATGEESQDPAAWKDDDAWK